MFARSTSSTRPDEIRARTLSTKRRRTRQCSGCAAAEKLRRLTFQACAEQLGLLTAGQARLESGEPCEADETAEGKSEGPIADQSGSHAAPPATSGKASPWARPS